MINMRQANTLLKEIKEKQAKIGVIGLGYVGLPLAVLLAEKGFSVTGFVRSKKKEESLKKGESNLADEEFDKRLKNVLKKANLIIHKTEKKSLKDQNVIIICVPTPVNTDRTPDLTDLIGVS